MSLANVARPKARGEKTAKGIHYVVFREKAADGSNEWDTVSKFWGTESPATMADDILAAIKNSGEALEAAIRLAYIADKDIRDAAVKAIHAAVVKAVKDIGDKADAKAKADAAAAKK